MLIEISPSWQLVNPAYALTLGLIIILAVALATYFLTRNYPQARKWQALLSEALVAVGVIGLLTFAARAHMDFEIRHDAKQLEENRRLARVASMDLLKMNCLREQPSIRPTPELENIWIACDGAFTLIENDEDIMTYWRVHDQLKRLTKTPNQKSEDTARFDALKVTVKNVIDTDREAAYNLHRKMLVERDVSWILILVCAVSAMLGIGLKWAKAIFEFRKATPG